MQILTVSLVRGARYQRQLGWHRGDESSIESTLNKPAAGNAEDRVSVTIEHHWPGVPEPGRSPS